ncbi:MAG: hypothetical protein ACFB3T_09860 [Geminicoccaceae bacterium]
MRLRLGAILAHASFVVLAAGGALAADQTSYMSVGVTVIDPCAPGTPPAFASMCQSGERTAEHDGPTIKSVPATPAAQPARAQPSGS